MKVELLFPEIANQFGDLGNMRYLARCLPQAEFCDTHLGEEPRFLREPVNLVYLGPMSEQGQEKVLEVLRPHRFALQKQLQEGTPFLFTGNALELLGERIENEDGTRVEGLGLFPLTARRDMLHRHNSIFLGSFEGEPVMGYKSQFTMAYPGDKSLGLFLRERGVGLNPRCPFEGVRVQNFFGTYLLGPLLINNPPFTRYLLRTMGAGHAALAFEPEVQAAYEKRLEDFQAKA